ncbi:helix-turn-helix domain-containing protein [Rhodopirellula europaea]|uniref:helix-turn-helix domain-containing protein n=1 Tax=Rhodopirellula europaea TaxID=1263866 RepID=UPI00058763BA
MFTVGQAALRLGVSTRFVYRLCATGTMEHFRLGSAIRISSEQLERYLQSAKNEAPQQPARKPQTKTPALQFLRLKS